MASQQAGASPRVKLSLQSMSEQPASLWGLSVQYLKGVGPHRAALLKKLNIETAWDLFSFIPFRYEDRTVLRKISALSADCEQTVCAEIKTVSRIETRHRGMTIVEVIATDDTGTLRIKWFNQPYLKDLFKKGDRVLFSGKIKWGRYGVPGLEMENPLYEKVDEEEPHLHLGRIVPIYHETKGINSRFIRSLIYRLIHQYASTLPEIFPEALLAKYHFMTLSQAIAQIHFPPETADRILLASGKSPAQQRLAFNEFFLLQIGLAMRKRSLTLQTGISFNVAGPLVARLCQQLPFKLTSAQHRVIAEIRQEMASPAPMNRLLQGDVGSGKTVVALMAIVMAIDNRYQAALMAPTEILAEQHFLSLKGPVESLGKTLGLLTRDTKKTAREELLKKIAAHEVDVIIGTHALIQEEVKFARLGLVVVDEQHKFGVLQRARLMDKGVSPDTLVMTATPIPRTLALTLYGDLTVSVIDELPPGRSPIQTFLFRGKQRDQAYQRIREEIGKGRQVYVVCPLIEASEKVDFTAATQIYTTLRESVFPDQTIGLLHGRLKREEKEAIMRAFKAKEINLLVATTVIEVGIDVPNATVMMIEQAERFGLAQLHQLRGRVGRGAEKSYCLMMASFPISQEGRRRLETMVTSGNGFVIAEADLEIRGPGEFLGTRQSGLPELKIAHLIRDAALLNPAREEAFAWIEADPDLTHPESLALRTHLEQKWAGKLEQLRKG